MSAFSQKSKSNPSSPSAFNSRQGDDFFGVQAKLNIGKSNDKYEVEADSVANQVVSKKQNSTSESFFSPSPAVQKKSNEPKKDENAVQKKSLVENITPVVPVSYTHLTLPTTPYV